MNSKDHKESLPKLVEKLLSLSRQIIATKADYMVVIEEYAQNLAAIESHLSETTLSPTLTARLNELEGQHLQVMAKVAKDKEKIRSELGNLKKKGKVVITYTDQMPKRISLSTTKKV